MYIGTLSKDSVFTLRCEVSSEVSCEVSVTFIVSSVDKQNKQPHDRARCQSLSFKV